jgi:galactoside O-acetyltransferase
MMPIELRFIQGGDVILRQHAIIGTNSTILPNVTINEGAAIGAMSLVIKDIPEWSICVGVPCRKIKARSKKLLEMIPHNVTK